jgi:uncharacterized SAM-binding protein YcdF (DUF218 family)
LPNPSSSRQSRPRKPTRPPTRRPRHRYKPIKMKRMGWLGRSIILFAILVLGIFTWAALARRFAPASNTGLEHFDAIIVLGYPADSDGNPTPEQLARVTEGVREYERGIAPRLIFTGGAAHNRFVEADVMARTAAAQGIPPSAIFIETKAQDTIENACYTQRIMEAHGWRSAEVVSAASHLPRAGMIFSRLPLKWSMHAAPPLQPASAPYSSATTFMEVLKTARYLTYARWTEQCQS